MAFGGFKAFRAAVLDALFATAPDAIEQRDARLDALGAEGCRSLQEKRLAKEGSLLVLLSSAFFQPNFNEWPMDHDEDSRFQNWRCGEPVHPPESNWQEFRFCHQQVPFFFSLCCWVLQFFWEKKPCSQNKMKRGKNTKSETSGHVATDDEKNKGHDAPVNMEVPMFISSSEVAAAGVSFLISAVAYTITLQPSVHGGDRLATDDFSFPIKFAVVNCLLLHAEVEWRILLDILSSQCCCG